VNLLDILTPNGLFPDVIRQTSKFIAKTYKNQEHFNEALLSVQEKVSVVTNIDQWNFGCTAVALHYNLHQNDVKALFTFLAQSRNIPFSNLNPVQLDVLKAPNIQPNISDVDMFVK